MKRLQNQIAGSRYTLPVTMIYGALVWLLAGLIQHQWWLQFALFNVAALLMLEFTNINVLIRIYSRSVSSAFVMLSCAAVFLFPSTAGAAIQLILIASLITLFRCYQDKVSTGWTFYAFLCLGLASVIDIHVVYLLPAYWIIMAWHLYSMSWRTFLASILGLIAPYWFMLAWLFFLGEEGWLLAGAHFTALGDVMFPIDYTVLSLPRILFFVLMVGLGITGTVHFVRTSSRDKIRTRQLYYSFILLGTVAILLLALQPQLYDLMIRVLLITTSPLIGHFVALTSTKVTNIAFLTIVVVVLALTVYCLWM